METRQQGKRLIIINGAPGIGKTTTCEELAKILPRNIYLDCDCFMWATPYVKTEETDRTRHENIVFTTNSYLSCSEYDNVIINWVFVDQEAIDEILMRLELPDVKVHTYSLLCRPDIWKMRMENDKINLKRKINTTFEKWTKRIDEGYYENIKARKIDTSDISAKQVAQVIAEEMENNP
jgi:adenylate kinase family enzyme